MEIYLNLIYDFGFVLPLGGGHILYCSKDAQQFTTISIILRLLIFLNIYFFFFILFSILLYIVYHKPMISFSGLEKLYDNHW